MTCWLKEKKGDAVQTRISRRTKLRIKKHSAVNFKWILSEKKKSKKDHACLIIIILHVLCPAEGQSLTAVVNLAFFFLLQQYVISQVINIRVPFPTSRLREYKLKAEKKTIDRRDASLAPNYMQYGAHCRQQSPLAAVCTSDNDQSKIKTPQEKRTISINQQTFFFKKNSPLYKKEKECQIMSG